MTLYQYQAITASGEKTRGSLTAESIESAKEQLLKKKLFLTSIKPKVGYEKRVKLSPEDLLSFTSSMAQLLRAGLPLYDCLVTMEEKFAGHRHHPLFLDLRDLVGQGRSLSYALGKYPKIFDTIYTSLIESGEETATLPTIFDQLTLSLSKQNKLRKQVSSAMIYPAFLGVFCVVVVIGLFTFLIPSMKDLLEDRPLHPLTQSVLNFSDFLSENGGVLVLGIATVVFGAIYFFRSKRGKHYFGRISLRLPIVGRLKTQAVLVRFCRSFAVLLSSGVPAHRALILAGRVMHNEAFEEAVEKVRLRVMEGGKISEELAQSPLFPKMVSRMVSTGEDSGNLEKMLFHLAEMYEEELEKSLSQFMNLLQPVMILILGLIVGFVLLSVLLPLTDVSSFLN